MLISDVGFFMQVPKLLSGLGLEETLVHGSAQITDRGMVSVPFSHLCSFSSLQPFCFKNCLQKFSPIVESKAKF